MWLWVMVGYRRLPLKLRSGGCRAPLEDDTDDFDHDSEFLKSIQVSTSDNWPCLTLSDKFRKKIQSRWMDCLIVKMLGRNIGFKVLEERLKWLWCLKGDYELVDLVEGFFLVKFTSLEDMHFALEHYLTVRRWCPDFCPCEASIDSTGHKITFSRYLLHKRSFWFLIF